MPGLRYAAGLVAAILIHIGAVALFPGFSQVVDLFLVVTLFTAVGGNLLGGMFGGMVAGLVADTLTGGLYGLYGFADTIIGYGAAFAAQRLVIQRATAVWLMFSIAAAVQQAVVTGLSQVLLQDPPLPSFLAVTLKVVSTGLIGMLSYLGGRRLARALGIWKKNRTARLR